jgi:hypothetical protein
VVVSLCLALSKNLTKTLGKTLYKALLPKTPMRCQEGKLKKERREICGRRVLLARRDRARQSLPLRNGTSGGKPLWNRLGIVAASHFFLAAIAKPPLTCREISDSLIQSASRIKRASHYDAILRILD